MLSYSDWVTMRDIDTEWARDQLKQVRASQDTEDAVIHLLVMFSATDGPESDSEDILDLFNKLAHGKALIPADTEGIWADAVPGAIKVGDTVRVKLDAFSGSVGPMHNGRVGRIVGIRYGDIIVKMTDGKPDLLNPRYSPHHLEKRIG
jgi:hypothetical protein